MTNTETVHVEGYGTVPVALSRIFSRFLVDAEDYSILSKEFGNDFVGMRKYILDNVNRDTGVFHFDKENFCAFCDSRMHILTGCKSFKAYSDKIGGSL